MPDKNLTALQMNVLDLLSEGKTTKEIMAELGCSESSIRHIPKLRIY